MKVTYDHEADVIQIVLRETAVDESDESKPGVILDYDTTRDITGIEILNASQRMINPRSVEYAISA